MKSRRVPFLSVVAVAGISACSNPPASEEWIPPCRTDKDCLGEQICQQQQCIDPEYEILSYQRKTSLVTERIYFSWTVEGLVHSTYVLIKTRDGKPIPDVTVHYAGNQHGAILVAVDSLQRFQPEAVQLSFESTVSSPPRNAINQSLKSTYPLDIPLGPIETGIKAYEILSTDERQFLGQRGSVNRYCMTLEQILHSEIDIPAGLVLLAAEAAGLETEIVRIAITTPLKEISSRWILRKYGEQVGYEVWVPRTAVNLCGSEYGSQAVCNLTTEDLARQVWNTNMPYWEIRGKCDPTGSSIPSRDYPPEGTSDGGSSPGSCREYRFKNRDGDQFRSRNALCIDNSVAGNTLPGTAPVDCDDDVFNDSLNERVPCGEEGRGLQDRRCVEGNYEAGSCVMPGECEPRSTDTVICSRNEGRCREGRQSITCIWDFDLRGYRWEHIGRCSGVLPSAPSSYCEGNQIYRDDGCTRTLAEICGDAQQCISAECVEQNPEPSPCENECNTRGARQCLGRIVRECTNVDSDPCLEWRNSVTCTEGMEECRSGACVELDTSFNGKIVFSSGNRSMHTTLVIFDGSPTSRRTISSNVDYSDPSWSPDGRKIALTRSGIRAEGSYRELATIGEDGSGLYILTNTSTYAEVNPSWSPTGSMLTYYSVTNSGMIVERINADGTGYRALTPDDGIRNFDPSWSPDGRTIAFASNRGGAYGIYLMDSEGSNIRRIGAVTGWGPVWSSDGRKIAYASVVDQSNSEIFVMNADGSNPINLTNNPKFDSSPSWSPDGTKIVFSRKLDVAAPYTSDIYIMNADGTGVVNITRTPAPESETDPNWHE